MRKLNIKKHLIQKYINKKIHNLIKKPMLTFLFNNNISDTLVKCNLFYTVNDSDKFVKTFGIKINDKIIYNCNHTIELFQPFSLITLHFFLIFFKKKKCKIINNFKKIKFYKYRSKLFNSKKKFIWTSSKEWLKEYSFLYTNKLSNLEFDWKSMSGIYLYNIVNFGNSNIYELSNISLYMSRSYTWKYLV